MTDTKLLWNTLGRTWLPTLQAFDSSTTTIYIKGEEITWVLQVFKYASVHHLETLGCPALHRFKNKKETVCAKDTVNMLVCWLRKEILPKKPNVFLFTPFIFCFVLSHETILHVC